MKLDVEFEEQVLAKCIRDTVYLKRASRVLSSHHFGTPQHAWIYDTIKDVWDKYRERCSAKYILSRARHDYPKDEEREPYVELARKLYKLKPDVAGAALKELSDFVRTVNAQLALEKAAKALEKDKIDEVYETMRTVSQRDLRPTTYTHIEWIEGFEERQAERKHRREHPEDHISIPTGLKKLDHIIGGVQLGELGLVLGTTGRGKSIMLNNLGWEAAKRGFNVCYFGFEMPARQIAMRQDARWLKMAYKKFKDYDFTPTELREIDGKLKRMKGRLAGKFQIVSMPVRSADINAVRAALDDLYVEKKFKAQLILMDSPDHLLPTGRSESYRLDQANIYWSVKAMAEEDGYAVWASTQAGKEFVKQLITAEAASESYDKARIADLMVSLNEPFRKSRATKVVDDDDDWDDSKEGGGIAPEVATRGKYLELFLAKYRDGKSAVTIPLDAEMEKMLIQEVGEGDDDDSSDGAKEAA
jgi:replicative DNA helicase